MAEAEHGSNLKSMESDAEFQAELANENRAGYCSFGVTRGGQKGVGQRTFVYLFNLC